MRRPIRVQLLIPFSTTLLIACGVIAATSAWLAVQRAESQTLKQIQNVVDTLAGSSLTYIDPILDKISVLLQAPAGAAAPTFPEVEPIDHRGIRDRSLADVLDDALNELAIRWE